MDYVDQFLSSAQKAKCEKRYQEALYYIDRAWEEIPLTLKNEHIDTLLLERADCYWYLKDHNRCTLMLRVVQSNGLPLSYNEGAQKETYDKWMSRGNELLDNDPSIAEAYFGWSFRHAVALDDVVRCQFLFGVAKCLSGDFDEGKKLIHRAWMDGYDVTGIILHWKSKGIKALEEGKLFESKTIFQRTLIVAESHKKGKTTEYSIKRYLVRVLFRLGEYQTALVIGEELYAARPTPSYEEAKQWQKREQILLDQGRTSLVVKCLTLALNYVPQVNKALRSTLLCQRSSAYHKIDELQAALEDAEEAISILPNDVEGYKCLVSCYKSRDDRKALSALNECLRTEYSSQEKFVLLQDAILIAVKLPEGTTTITSRVPPKSIEQLQKEAVESKDWEVLRVLYLGGGGPKKFLVGEGGLATGLRAEQVAIQDAVAANFSKKPETVAALLTHGAPVDGLGSGPNPLVYAVANGMLKVVKVLLDHGANPCVRNDQDLPVAHVVVRRAIVTGNFQMVQILLDSGHPDLENVQNSKGNTLYHLATSGKITNNKCKVIRLLLDANIDPTIRNKQGKLPTHCCKNNDDRRKMLERFLRERDRKAASNCLLFPVSTLKFREERQSSSNLFQTCDRSKHGNLTRVKGQESSLLKTKTKKELRNYLEQLIEGVTNENEDKDGSDNSEEEVEEEEKEEEKEEKEEKEEIEEPIVNAEVEEAELVSLKPEEVEKLENKSTFTKTDEHIENLEWEVDFSDKFLKRFRSKKLQPEMRRKIVDKVIMLAQGRRSRKLCKRLEGEPKKKGILLYESRLTKGARMLWEKTIAFSSRNSNDPELMLHSGQGVLYSDIIRVWDIVLDHENLEREIENVVKNIVKSHERGSRCIINTKLKGIRKEMPGSSNFSLPSFYQEQNENPSSDDKKQKCFYPPASSEENEYNILKFHPFTSGIVEALLDQSQGQNNISFPFKVTELEHAIINLKPDPPCPIILLGRSGSGKTICCLYRLWNEFKNYWEKAVTAGPLLPRYISATNTYDKEEASENCGALSSVLSDLAMGSNFDTRMEGAAKPMEQNSLEHNEHFHQLFITKSNVLCSEVQKNFQELKYACSATKSMTTVLDDPLPNRIQDIGETSWPLFIGARGWLLLLDASLPGRTFFKRAEDGSLLEITEGWIEDGSYSISIPDNREDDGNDGDDKTGDEEGENSTTLKDNRRKTKSKTANVRREVTYEVFRDELWPNMKRGKKVDYHPSLVWTEIKSFIKGSFEAMKSSSGFLTFKEYQDLGRKRSTNFMEDRSALYELFEAYERIRTSKGMYDESDLVYHLHRRLIENPEVPWSIHSVFVDETQDFTQAELFLLIRCCCYQNRMFFTGDTAQGIVRGIAFRFEDLKTLFHDCVSFTETTSRESVRTPDRLYQLTFNYRSHSGILKLASSVLSMLLYFFPESIDKLEEDRGLFDGPKPVLLESCSPSDLAMILRRNKRHASRIEFGAHQAVLVVSEEARDNMPEELKHGLVLTIYEAKGLEFDDVLIYNFFTNSQAKKEWKIATSDIESQHGERNIPGAAGIVEIKDKNTVLKTKGSHFEPSKHNILISELKLLYTAITRTRVNVWFFDEDEEARGPMFEYFQRLDLVRMNVLDCTASTFDNFGEPCLLQEDTTEDKEKPVVKTVADKWRDQGMVYYSKGLWAVAERCFSFAEDEVMIRICRIQQKAQDALKQRHNPGQMKEMFRSAAAEFMEFHMVEEAAVCLHNARERLLLAKLNMKMERFEDASKLFQSVGHYAEASKCVEILGNYSQSVEILCEAKLYEKAIEVLERYNSFSSDAALQEKDIVPPDPSRTIKQLCLQAAEAYLNDNKRKEMDAVLKRFSSADERISFLKRKMCFKEEAVALVENDRRQEAAKLLQLHGRFKEARKYFDDDKFLADCHFYEARSLNSRKLCANYHEEIVQHLEEAVKYYRRCKDKNGEAEALLFLGRQKDDPDLISESGKIFDQCHNICGKSEVVEERLEREGLTRCCETAVRTIEKLLGLIICLHKRPTRLNIAQQTQITMCEEYFGLSKVDDTKIRVYHTSFCERVHHIAPRDWFSGKHSNLQARVDVKAVYGAISRQLFVKAIGLTQKVTSFFSSKVELEANDDSYLVALLPFNEKFQILFNWVYMDGLVTRFYNHLKQLVISPILSEAEKILPQEKERLFLSCKLFTDLLFPGAGLNMQHPTDEQIAKIRTHHAVKPKLVQYCNHLRKASVQTEDAVLRASQTMELLNMKQEI